MEQLNPIQVVTKLKDELMGLRKNLIININYLSDSSMPSEHEIRLRKYINHFIFSIEEIVLKCNTFLNLFINSSEYNQTLLNYKDEIIKKTNLLRKEFQNQDFQNLHKEFSNSSYQVD